MSGFVWDFPGFKMKSPASEKIPQFQANQVGWSPWLWGCCESALLPRHPLFNWPVIGLIIYYLRFFPLSQDIVPYLNARTLERGDPLVNIAASSVLYS